MFAGGPLLMKGGCVQITDDMMVMASNGSGYWYQNSGISFVIFPRFFHSTSDTMWIFLISCKHAWTHTKATWYAEHWKKKIVVPVLETSLTSFQTFCSYILVSPPKDSRCQFHTGKKSGLTHVKFHLHFCRSYCRKLASRLWPGRYYPANALNLGAGFNICNWPRNLLSKDTAKGISSPRNRRLKQIPRPTTYSLFSVYLFDLPKFFKDQNFITLCTCSPRENYQLLCRVFFIFPEAYRRSEF